MLHLRAICPEQTAQAVLDTLHAQAGVVAVRRAGQTSHGIEITADLPRESGEKVFDALRRLGVFDAGMATLDPLDTAIGAVADKAARDAPGEGADALIWDELVERTGEDSTLTGTFLTFMILATLLAAIGVVTDSQVTIVGAMVVGPEFGPLAALAVALLRRRGHMARRATTALLVGFPIALVVTALLSAVARVAGLISPDNITGSHRATDFIYHPGWFSLITALVAGTAGMLSLMSSKSAALVGVFISVTTIPAAGNAAVAGVLGEWDETWRSVAQLAINLAGIVAAGVATLAARETVSRARATR
jgi:uncharacterized hydrophobic protein (TIGR00271 family)